MARTYNIDIDSYIGYPISKGYVSAKLKPLQGKPCAVRINSYGGDVMTALDIRQQFIDHGQVTAYIMGMTASAATILAMGAKKVVMSRYALMLVHPCSNLVATFSYYNHDELERVIESLRKLQSDMATIDSVIASVYADKSEREGKDMAALMQEERWITAEEALKYGLIDAIDEDDDLSAAPAKMTNAEREHFMACGLPLPEAPTHKIEDKMSGNVQKSDDNAPEAATAAPAIAAENVIKNDNNSAAAAAPTSTAENGAEGEKVSVIDQLISVIHNFFKSTGAPETAENSTKTVENETNNTPTTMNETKLYPVNLCKVLALESLSVDAATGNINLTTQQVEGIDTYIKEAIDQITQLKAEKADIEKTIDEADGATTTQAMPTNEAAEGNAIPGAEAVDFFSKFKGLIG